MNDFSRKNVILGFSKLMSMPYQYHYNVQIPQQDIEDYHELFDGDIDNLYTQHIDNDLYIENQLKYSRDIVEGIKSGDYDSVRLGSNGYKFSSSDDGVLNFYRKVETELSASLQQKTVSEPVNFITCFGSKVYCGTDYGIAQYDYTLAESVFEYAVEGNSRCCQVCNGLMTFGVDSRIAVLSGDILSAAWYDVVADGIRYNPKTIQYTQVRQTIMIVCDDGQTLLSANTSNGFSAAVLQPALPAGVSINDVMISEDSGGFSVLLLTTSGVYQSVDDTYESYQKVFEDELGHLNVFKYKSFSGIGTIFFTDCGLYGYSSTDSSVYKMSGSDQQFNDAIDYYTDGSKTWRLGAAGGNIITSYNLRRWLDFLSLSGVSELRQICVLGKKDLVFGSSDGVYVYRNGYDTVLDSIRFTEESIYQMYNDNDEYIEGQMDSTILEHILSSHNPDGSYQKINDDYIDVGMESLCAFTTPEKDISVELSSASYDYVYKITTGNTADCDDVQVKVRNFATGNEYVTVTADYTVKLWKSGFNEFDVYIPTTKTYYLNHVPGVPKCENNPVQAIYRKNLNSVNIADKSISTYQTSEMSSHYTDVILEILSTQYDIENVINMSIRGNSLPLGIYKDSLNSESHGGATGLFHSFIEPSMMFNDYDISKTDEYEKYQFHGCCFGTDSQAIRLLTTTKTIHYYDGNMLSVVFHGNGRYTDQYKTQYLQKLRLGENNEISAWTIAGNRFAGNTASDYFYGWTTQENPSDDDLDIDVKKAGSIITLDDFKKKSVLHLYAAWVTVNWNTSHTEIDLYEDEPTANNTGGT